MPPVPVAARRIVAPDRAPGMNRRLEMTGPACRASIEWNRPPYHNPGTNNARFPAIPGNGHARRKKGMAPRILRRSSWPLSSVRRRRCVSGQEGSC